MSTFAVWCQKNNNNSKDENTKLELHFNFWKLICKRKRKYLLDIGFMVDNIEEIKSIKFYVPLKIIDKDIIDLGIVLKEHQDLINMIFNAEYHIHNINNQKQIIVDDAENNEKFCIYCIDKSKDLEIDTTSYEGTVLSIKTNNININGCKKCYFRFRICSPNLINLIKEHKHNNKYFQSAITSTEVIDFRLNEKRLYNASLSENIIRDGEFDIKKIHFLLLRNSTDELISFGRELTCRELERDSWKDYIIEDFDQDIFAYHWKEIGKMVNDKSKPIKSFNLLVRFKYYKANFSTIVVYIISIGILTIGLNLLSSLLYSKFTSDKVNLRTDSQVESKITNNNTNSEEPKSK